MLDDQELWSYITLFRGRGDCYGSWEGGCIREPLQVDTFAKHLAEGPHIGVYPCVNSLGVTQCVWGCTDIDYDEPAEAWTLHDAFKSVGVTSWVEKTRRGYHIWVFTPELVLASDMRKMFLAAHQVTELNPKEVNPKQMSLLAGQLGNYVRLPYPNYENSTERQMIERDGTPIPLSQFITRATNESVDSALISKMAGYYNDPTPVYTNVSAPSLDMQESARRLTRLGRVIFNDGPTHRDRSTTLTHLAHECRKSNLNPEDAMQILEDADLRWGKYMIRGEVGRLEIQKLLIRAYGPIQFS